MSNSCVVWVTGTVISESGYPRKNAEVKGVLMAGNRKLGATCSATDYSGQYFLSFETDSEEPFAEQDLRVLLNAQSIGQTEEFGRLEIELCGEREFERDIRLGLARAAVRDGAAGSCASDPEGGCTCKNPGHARLRTARPAPSDDLPWAA